MSESLKKATIHAAAGHSYTFYWACWSLNVAIVKDRKGYGHTWKVLRTLETARCLWNQLSKECCGPVGEKEVVTYDEGVRDSERIRWVRKRLAE